MKLKGKVALITGGVRGIGKAVALAYAREGAKLAICSRTQSEIDTTVREIRGLKGECHGWVCDVSLEESVKNLIQEAQKAYGRIDILINNAGVMTRPAPVTEFDVKKWDYTIAVNLRGPFLVTKEILPLMIGQQSGSIINVSSGLGRTGYANFAAYSVSKWGVEGFTQTLSAETQSYGIRVNSVDPGYVATKMTRHQGRDPNSVTEVFVFLGSDESRGITGRMLSSSRWTSEIKG
jgi:NAD(P)-dependent dehydrogenase (short-subunit alcohol dehydrogenase family)